MGGGERRVGNSRRACGGAGEPGRSGVPALIGAVFRNGLGVGGIELGALVEVVGEESLGDLVLFPTVGPHGEFGLRRSPGGMKEWGRGGLSDMGQDSSDGLRVRQGPNRSGDRRRGVVVGAVWGGNAIKVRGSWQVGQISGKTS